MVGVGLNQHFSPIDIRIGLRRLPSNIVVPSASQIWKFDLTNFDLGLRKIAIFKNVVSRNIVNKYTNYPASLIKTALRDVIFAYFTPNERYVVHENFYILQGPKLSVPIPSNLFEATPNVSYSSHSDNSAPVCRWSVGGEDHLAVSRPVRLPDCRWRFCGSSQSIDSGLAEFAIMAFGKVALQIIRQNIHGMNRVFLTRICCNNLETYNTSHLLGRTIVFGQKFCLLSEAVGEVDIFSGTNLRLGDFDLLQMLIGLSFSDLGPPHNGKKGHQCDQDYAYRSKEAHIGFRIRVVCLDLCKNQERSDSE